MNTKKIIFLLSSVICAQATILGQEPYANGRNFRSIVEKRMKQDGKNLADVCPVDSSPVAKRVFQEYGAVFVAVGVLYPSKCVFADEVEVKAFQDSLVVSSAKIAGVTVQLQKTAMDALLNARKTAIASGLSITPRGGSASSKRSYANTQSIWNSRFSPALKYWTRLGKISKADAGEASKMGTQAQVERVMEWENQGYFFNTNFSRTIFSSVAAPGTSQHLSLLALDVRQFANADVRKILNQHGWFQTIVSDTPHFTFVGVDESQLTKLGLHTVEKDGFTFWVPNI